jgi:hypothetical protein
MLVACRLAGLSALILDHVGGVAVAQLSALGGQVTDRNVSGAANAYVSRRPGDVRGPRAASVSLATQAAAVSTSPSGSGRPIVIVPSFSTTSAGRR